MNKQISNYFDHKDQLSISNLDYRKSLTNLFIWFLRTDQARKDITTTSLPSIQIQTKIITRENIRVAGMEEIAYVLKSYNDIRIKIHKEDRQDAKKGDILAELSGESRTILSLERSVINIVQRMSGIATETHRLVDLIKVTTNTLNPSLAATRKTPWMTIDKKAVTVGGGLSHRLSLQDGILIKDNHLKVIEKAYKIQGEQKTVVIALGSVLKKKVSFIEIEVKTFTGLITAVKTRNELNKRQPIAIMLDNWKPDKAKQALEQIKKSYDMSNIFFEASGGITDKNLQAWASSGVDVISLGSLTHSSHAVDISLEFD